VISHTIVGNENGAAWFLIDPRRGGLPNVAGRVTIECLAAPSIEASYCVSETTFEFVVVRHGLSVDTPAESMFINADGLWTDVSGGGSSEATDQIWVYYGFDAGAGPIIVRQTGRTLYSPRNFVIPPVRWELAATNVGTVSAVEVSTGVWDVTYHGSVPNGPDTWWTAGAPPASYGDVRQTAVAAGFNMDLEIESTPIAPCAEPPPEPTSSTSSTTSSTVPPTVAPTSIVSTTVAGTTTIPEVETDIPKGDFPESVVPLLVAVGFLALVGATIRARRFER
jgi:hypothetical protein